MKNKTEAPVCGVTYIDEERVKKIEEDFPAGDLISDASEILKVLGDPTRLRIVLALAREELCVCDLSVIAQVSVSAVSHQLRLLRGQRLVKFQKKGKMVYYSLADKHINSIVDMALEHADELQK
ncbi:MAG: winged helix-turn-helix transcriptional regulator [Chlorobi bacterium]|nr:winged helix-turn-helix transcriptional regulator [Chlorobiota bacterium]